VGTHCALLCSPNSGEKARGVQSLFVFLSGSTQRRSPNFRHYGSSPVKADSPLPALKGLNASLSAHLPVSSFLKGMTRTAGTLEELGDASPPHLLHTSFIRSFSLPE